MISNDDDSIVYLNGEYVRLGDAKVSVLDRGFIFGDGVYEVVPVYGGKPFRMEHHLARLFRSLTAIHIESPLQREDFERIVSELISLFGPGNCIVYLQITRGVAKRDHAYTKGVEPTIFAMVSPFNRPDARFREQGLTTIGIPDQRWYRCDIKAISLLGNLMARQVAVEAGVDDVLQFREGYLTEASAANIWVVKDGVLLAPPLNNLILEGIRYNLMEELASACGIPFEARPIREEEVDVADELMLTSATKEVLPITRYNGKPVGAGVPGPVYARLRAAYDDVVAALTRENTHARNTA